MSVIGTFSGILNDATNATGSEAVAHTATKAVAGFALSQIASWVLTGTEDALRQVASSIGATTAPNLDSTWFSSTYWRVAALAAMLTVPFICAAAVQALARSDMALLVKSVFGYLPLSLLGVSLAAPLTMLLLAATDQMSSAVSATGIKGGAHFLDQAAAAAAGLSAADGSLFFAVIIGLFALLAALALAIELLVREAAVYVVVLMLPLAFAAMVWPARRVWGVRMVELLVSLVLSKFVIVAVLSLAGAALASGGNELSTLLTAMALVVFATFAPWALMRILPFTELAAGTAGMMRHELPHVSGSAQKLWGHSGNAAEMAMSLPDRLRRQAQDANGGFSSEDSPATSSGPGQSGEADGLAQSSTGEDSGAGSGLPAGLGLSAEPDTELGAQPTVAREPDPATASGQAAQSQPSAASGQAAQSQPATVSGSATQPEPPVATEQAVPREPASEAQRESQSQPDALPATGAAAANNESPSDDARGPVRLPEMWRTQNEPWDELPEMSLGPELAAGPFNDPHSTDPPGSEESE